MLIAMMGLLVLVFNTNKKIEINLPQKLVSISKVSAFICMVIGITMLADLTMPKNTVIEKATKTESRTMDFGIYSETMNESAYTAIKNNETVKLSVSKIYDEIKKITLLEEHNKILDFPTVDDYMFILLTIMYFLPCMLFFKKSPVSGGGKYLWFLLHIGSIVLGITGILLLGKLFLVHGIHVLSRM